MFVSLHEHKSGQYLYTLREEILAGRNFGGWQKWRNLAEFNLADHEKIKFWREFNLADHAKIKFWQEFILADRKNRSILTKEKVQQKGKCIVEID